MTILQILTSNFEKVVCEFKNEEGKDRSFTPDEPGKSQSAGPSSGGLRPMIQDHIEELESGDKGNKPTASASMSKGSAIISALVGGSLILFLT